MTLQQRGWQLAHESGARKTRLPGMLTSMILAPQSLLLPDSEAQGSARCRKLWRLWCGSACA